MTTYPRSSKGYFEFWNLNAAGDEVDKPQKIMTDTGVILQCHLKCDANQIRHLCAIARKTPNYPVEITYWDGPEEIQVLLWSARIYWKNQSNEKLH